MQRELAAAIFSAYFLEARNIAAPDVLGEIASRHGFDRAGTERLLTDGQELEITREQARAAALGGIRGVPHFVIDGQYTLSGAQPADVFRRAMARYAGGG